MNRGTPKINKYGFKQTKKAIIIIPIPIFDFISDLGKISHNNRITHTSVCYILYVIHSNLINLSGFLSFVTDLLLLVCVLVTWQEFIE